MQDFAKYDRLLTEPDRTPRQWRPDIVGTMFGLVFVVITALAILNEDKTLEIEQSPITQLSATDTATGVVFDFYEELKREDLYPALKEVAFQKPR